MIFSQLVLITKLSLLTSQAGLPYEVHIGLNSCWGGLPYGVWTTPGHFLINIYLTFLDHSWCYFYTQTFIQEVPGSIPGYTLEIFLEV